MSEEKARQVWICTHCGTAYENQIQASKCWDSHIELTIEYIHGGIGSKTDMPIECIIKKREGGYITEIGTYKLERIDQVKIRERVRRKNG